MGVGAASRGCDIPAGPSPWAKRLNLTGKTEMAVTLNKDGLIVDAESGRPVATNIDSFVTCLGEGAQSDIVMLRLHHRDWPGQKQGHALPANQMFQFALRADRAALLGQHLLELAAQAEKEAQERPDH